jgi:uncharacterized protein (TIGR00730 family)
MTNPQIPERIFPEARDDAQFAKLDRETEQTSSPSYRLAFQDTEFLLRPDLRPVRFQLELLKPELLMNEADIGSMMVFYGSARIPAPDEASTNTDPAIAARLEAKSHYYEVARELARLASKHPRDPDGTRHFVVCSGGGPSIMEAANRGARDVGADTVGLNIVLPHEQAPNTYVTPSLSFQFHYFALRKMHFLLRARAVAVFPGGFGTFDEMFELLTLIQTGKIPPMPVLMYGREFWERVVDWNALVDEGVISPADLGLLTWVETAQEGWEFVRNWYERDSAASDDAQATA